MTLYKTIVADPPWPEYGGGRIKRGADRHYKLMSVNEIKAMAVQVRRLTDQEGCHLYLWVTNNYLPYGFEVMREWDFEYKTCITWVKEAYMASIKGAFVHRSLYRID